MAWNRFVELYAPLILYWGKQHGLSDNDSSDLVQDVLSDLVVKLRTFEYDAKKRFRGWLLKVVTNRAKNILRRERLAPQSVGDTEFTSIIVAPCNDVFSEHQYRFHIATRALDQLRQEFEETTWQAANLQLTKQMRATEVAAKLGLTVGAVYTAKSRVLKRLRDELEGLLD